MSHHFTIATYNLLEVTAVTNKGHEDDCVSPLYGVIISKLKNIRSDFDVVDDAIWSRIVSQCNKYF